MRAITLPMTAANVFAGSDGEATKQYYAELEKRGLLGRVAMNLFRAQKCSSRAKVYRGGQRGRGSYRSMAYERKEWSLAQLVMILIANGSELERVIVAYGWKPDPAKPLNGLPSWVLYIDLPNGQVSFHAPARGNGPDYAGGWDGEHQSEKRIIAFCDAVMWGDLK